MNDITQLLESVSRGQQTASNELLPLVYDELRHLAAARMARESAGHTLQPTALVHEAWMRLVKPGDRHWNNRAHFFRAAAQAMRRILVDRARLKSSIKRGANPERLDFEALSLAETTPDDRVMLVDDALSQLEQQDPDSGRIVTLKFFGGFTNREIAETLGETERTVERQWAYARACLLEFMRTSDLPKPIFSPHQK